MDQKLRFGTLTAQEKDFLMNGCGSEKLAKFGKRFLPDWIQFNSCNHHDVNYAIGCDEKARKRADNQFRNQMLAEVWQLPWKWRIPRAIQAMFYWRMVARFGKNCFYYADHELTRSELHEQMIAEGVTL